MEALIGLPDFVRFFTKVKIAPTGCWEWQGAMAPHNYGQFGFQGKVVRSSRWSYEYFKGKIPDGMFACHKCDNPPCVNPDHLFIGTMKDNMRDASRKKRLGRTQNKIGGSCRYGHALVGNNLRFRFAQGATGIRTEYLCRSCLYYNRKKLPRDLPVLEKYK
jgi:hypothetical protein